MRNLIIMLVFASACSKPEQAPPSPTSNAAALQKLQEQRDAPLENKDVTVGGDELDRMEVFSTLKAPSTPGNPSYLNLCAVLYDKGGRAVAAEGKFDVTSDLEFSAGQYVYAPMFGPLDFPGNTYPLGACPAGGELWPNRLQQLQGKTVSIQVKFTSASDKVLTAATTQSF